MIELKGGPRDGDEVEDFEGIKLLTTHWDGEECPHCIGHFAIHAYDREGNYLGEDQ